MSGYEAAVIEKATNGAVTAKHLANWTNRGLWLLSQPDPERGKPRYYTRAHVIEAALASALMEAGVSRENAKKACKHRAIHHHGSSGWVGETEEGFASLPEFAPDITGVFWVVIIRYSQDGDFDGVFTKPVRGADALGPVIADLGVGAVVVLNVSAIVAAVDAAIAAA